MLDPLVCSAPPLVVSIILWTALSTMECNAWTLRGHHKGELHSHRGITGEQQVALHLSIGSVCQLELRVVAEELEDRIVWTGAHRDRFRFTGGAAWH